MGSKEIPCLKGGDLGGGPPAVPRPGGLMENSFTIPGGGYKTVIKFLTSNPMNEMFERKKLETDCA